ncbi:MAG: hypothetical protein AAFS10_23615 [Myxococcota bacterium]
MQRGKTMKIDRLFNVLVVGGALVAATACGGSKPTPDPAPTQTTPMAEPSSAPTSTPGADGKPQQDAETDKKDGVCSWL